MCICVRVQANPVLTGNLPVLLEEEESVSMGVGEDEEGAIADNSLDKMAESSPKLKVNTPSGI